jgi:hypothetical protein
MNKLIDKLALLSSKTTTSYYDGRGNVTETYFNREKFAELIVRECIEKITTYDLVPGHSAKWEDIYDIHARLLQDLGEELKEHFGVEE